MHTNGKEDQRITENQGIIDIPAAQETIEAQGMIDMLAAQEAERIGERSSHPTEEIMRQGDGVAGHQADTDTTEGLISQGVGVAGRQADIGTTESTIRIAPDTPTKTNCIAGQETGNTPNPPKMRVDQMPTEQETVIHLLMREHVILK
jgi:hypothetical protein